MYLYIARQKALFWKEMCQSKFEPHIGVFTYCGSYVVITFELIYKLRCCPKPPPTERGCPTNTICSEHLIRNRKTQLCGILPEMTAESKNKQIVAVCCVHRFPVSELVPADP